MIRFIIAVSSLAAGLPLIVVLCFKQRWLPVIPSFLYETTWLVAIATTVIFVYLYRPGKASVFVQLYLLSMVVKLIAYFCYNLIMIKDDSQGAVVNVLYFLMVYTLFTAVEIAFLYKRISGSSRS